MADEVDLAEVERIIHSVGRKESDLIAILQAIQSRYAYLPPEALRHIPACTAIKPEAIAGVSTFYAQFRLKPAGKHTVKVCIGTACHVKGAETVFSAFKRHLEIPEHEDTDKDRLFTVEKVACLGCCMIAPAVQIDDITYGYVYPPKVGSVLRDFLASAKGSSETGTHVAHGAPAGEVRICLCSSCVAGGTAAVFQEARDLIREDGLPVTLRSVGCTGVSYQTPLLEIAMPDGSMFHYGKVKPANMQGILRRHFKPQDAGRRLRAAAVSLLDRLLTDEAWEPVVRYSVDLRDGGDAAYFGNQMRLATADAGQADPMDLDAYIAAGGFSQLTRCLNELAPSAIVDEIARSGLRGRGGAGFPTGRKWAAVSASPGTEKYVICNGDEGDPGAFMDRMILESFPFRVIEGMLIAAYAVGAREGIFYVREEYPLAVKRVLEAMSICEKRGLLGSAVMGSKWVCRLRLVRGAGAFVCGEETALMAAVEGQRGMPRYRPPFPAERGLFGKPTLINNVETLALIPWIVRNGAEAFAALGTEKSKGTKAFALAGKIERGGLIEVPMGMPLRQIVETIGGGVGEGRVLKAVQVGGPSGGCIPASLSDTPVDYDALQSAGAIMGSGGMVVLDDMDCMVDMSRYFLSFTQRESCGKCTFCRIGTKRMLEVLERLCHGQGKKGDIEELEHLSVAIQKGSLCGLGRTAPNPIISMLRHFRSEYEAHLVGRCPAKKCKDLIAYVVTDECIGCTKCAQICPVKAIPVTPYRKHSIDVELCTRCDSCRVQCPVKAIEIHDLVDVKAAPGATATPAKKEE